MNVTLNNDGGKTLVVLDGRLDTTNVEQFQKDIKLQWQLCVMGWEVWKKEN